MSIGRCVAMVKDDEYEELMAFKAGMPTTRFGDGYNPAHVEQINEPTQRLQRLGNCRGIGQSR